jgi:hypothetical protein
MARDRRSTIVSVVLVIAVALMLPTLARVFAHWFTMPSEEARGLDFTRYYVTALVGRRAGWSHLYDLAAQQRVAEALGVSVFLPNVYTPAMSFLVAPFTFLTPETAYLVWAMIALSSLIVCAVVLVPGPLLVRVVVLLTLFIPYSSQLGILEGQVIPLQMMCVALSYRRLILGDEVGAGLLLVSLVLKPQGMQLLPFALLVAGHRRAFLSFVAGAAVLAAGTLLAVGTTGAFAYLDRLAWAQAHPSEMMVAWEYTLARRFVDPALRASVLSLAAVVTLVAARRLRTSPELVFAAAIIGSLLASPYLHLYDFLWLFPAGWLVFRSLPGWWSLVSLATVYVFVYFSAPEHRGARWVLLCECAWLLILALLPRGWIPTSPVAPSSGETSRRLPEAAG